MSAAPKMRRASGAPSFCWHCNRQLQRAPGRGLGLFFFHLVRNPIGGHEYRVHGDCLHQTLLNGEVRLVRPEAEKPVPAYIPQMGDVNHLQKDQP